MSSSPVRDLIARLEATAEQQDELTARLIDELKEWDDASMAYVEAIERHAQNTAMARSAVIVEAAMLITGRRPMARRPRSAVQ